MYVDIMLDFIALA